MMANVAQETILGDTDLGHGISHGIGWLGDGVAAQIYCTAMSYVPIRCAAIRGGLI